MSTLKALTCPQCGAAVPRGDASRCEYCGATLVAGSDQLEGGPQAEVWDVRLEVVPPDRSVDVIMALREVTRLGLQDCKRLADGAPQLVASGRTRESAEQIAETLRRGGAEVSLQRGR